MTEPVVHVHADKQALADAAGARLQLALVESLEAGSGPVHLVLTGGSMGSAILASLGSATSFDLIDWDRVHLWWGDERYLPAGDPERNQTQNGEALLDHIHVPAGNIHTVAGPDTAESAEASAAAYGAALRADGSGEFDITLLGVGPDGHIASLFPHHPAQRTENAIAIAVHDSPKPPPDRVSLTFECLNRSRRVWFLVAGKDKAEAVAAALRDGADRWDVPASGVKGSAETLWLLDAEAAGRLPDQD